jgi:hypothetical protein
MKDWHACPVGGYAGQFYRLVGMHTTVMLKNNICNIIYMPRSSNKPVINKPIVNKPVVQNRLPDNGQPNLFSSIKQGFGFGIGSSIAHNIFDRKEAKSLHPGIDTTTEFKQCMEKTYNNYEECAPILK